MTRRPTLRQDAAGGVARLRTAGVRNVVMVTGDRRPAREGVGRGLGVDAVHADLSPEGKVAVVRASGSAPGPGRS